jgi:hypothetical protein
MMLFIIWLSFRLLLLVPNWDTIFFLCYRLHFCTLDSDYCSLTTVDRISIILVGNHFTILLSSTTAIKYLPGSSTPLWDYIYRMRVLSSLFQFRADSLPYLVPFIWLYWSMYIYYWSSTSLWAILLMLLIIKIMIAKPCINIEFILDYFSEKWSRYNEQIIINLTNR